MSRQLRWVLVLFVLMIAIWALVIVGARSNLWWLFLIGALWATVDFVRALWSLLHREDVEQDEEQPF